MPDAPFDVRPLTPAIGAELRGIDLSGRLSDEAFEVLHVAVRDHQVVFARGQELDEGGLRRLAERFGPLSVHPVAELAGTGRDVSVIVDSVERPPAGFPWHTDLSWTAAPPALGFLSALQIPPVGGDTLWASGPAMYERLSPAVRTMCDRLRVVHAPDERLLRSVRDLQGDALADRLVERHPPVEQPLVRVDPVSGRRSLWISPLYAMRIVGMGEPESEALLALLHGRADDPEVQVRWRWQEGDLAIWDEAATCHRALTDHHPQPRRMRRCTTVGPVPVGAGEGSDVVPLAVRRRSSRAPIGGEARCSA